MLKRIVVATVIAILLFTTGPAASYADGQCMKSELRTESQTYCTCDGGSCVNNTADTVNEFHRCWAVVTGEFGQTLCNDSDVIVGSRVDCTQQIAWGVLAGLLAASTFCEVVFYVELAMCVPTGPAYIGCLVAAVVVVSGCFIVTGVATGAPECWLYTCGADNDSRRDIIRKVTTSMGGEQCQGV